MTQIKEIVNRFHHVTREMLPVPRQQLVLLEKYAYVKHVSKNTLLHSPGEKSVDYYFICSGLVRFYYLTDNGKEVNKSFVETNRFFAAPFNILQQQYPRYYVEALEDTVLLCIPMTLIERLCESNIHWSNLVRIQFNYLVEKKVAKEAQLLLSSAQERYLSLVEDSPGLVDKLPNYHIASYIGVTQEALSRIRKRISKSSHNNLVN